MVEDSKTRKKQRSKKVVGRPRKVKSTPSLMLLRSFSSSRWKLARSISSFHSHSLFQRGFCEQPLHITDVSSLFNDGKIEGTQNIPQTSDTFCRGTSSAYKAAWNASCTADPLTAAISLCSSHPRRHDKQRLSFLPSFLLFFPFCFTCKT